MADVRCPMCGKQNPAEHEVCQFCQARLKPLHLNSDDASHDPDANLPDWLKDLRQRQASDSPEEEQSQSLFAWEDDEADEVPDWLSSMRSETGEADLEVEEPAADDGELDWLQRVGGGHNGAGQISDAVDWLQSDDGIEAGAEEELPDWLRSPDTQPESSVQAESVEQAPDDAEPDDDLLTWLNEPKAEELSGIENQQSENDSSLSGGLTDWLRGSEDEEQSPTAGTSAEQTAPTNQMEGADERESESLAQFFNEDAQAADVLPDWLRSPDGHETSELPADMAEDAASGEALPDWLTESEAGSGAAAFAANDDDAAESGDDLPEWLVETSDQEASSDQSAYAVPKDETEDEAALTEGMPDWLTGSEAGSDTAVIAAGDEELAPAEELPDWLKAPEDQVQAAPQTTFEFAAEDTEDEAAPAAGMPDWLTEFGVGSDTTDDEELAPVEGLPDWLQPTDEPVKAANDETSPSDMPDWVQSATGDTEEEVAPAEEIPEWLRAPEELETSTEPSAFAFTEDETEEDAVPAEGMPDWLTVFEADDAAGQFLSEEAEPVAEASGDIEDAPEWLATFDESSSAESDELQLSEPEGLDLEWLNELSQPTEDMQTAQEAEEDLATANLPVWLSDDDAKGAASPTVGEETEEAGLTPAELPSWLEAMRPGSAAAAAGMAAARGSAAFTDDEEVEGAGPLSGLRGILPAEPEVLRVGKPPAYSIKLQVTDVQQSNAELLERLIAAEGEPRSIPGRSAVTAQNILRLVIALLLIGAILVPMLTGMFSANLPLYTPEIGEVNRLVSDVTGGEPVLLAFDYTPATSGELDAAASAMVEHLMLRGAYLSLVSSYPLGPVQAEHLLDVIAADSGRDYIPQNQYINLGYIPGGQAGLLSFAQNLRSTMPYSLQDNSAAWNQPALAGVDSLDDFSLVTVITENPDTARNWIEQVQPFLNDTPMLFVVSAQAEPLVRPYYHAGQVQGMIVGVAGGAAYENLQGQPGLAASYWSAFSLGGIAAIVSILIAGLVSVWLPAARRDDKTTSRKKGSKK